MHDPAGPQEEGYYVVAPPAAWQMEDWGFYTILTADPGVYWKITMILLDEGYYDSDDICTPFSSTCGTTWKTPCTTLCTKPRTNRPPN